MRRRRVTAAMRVVISGAGVVAPVAVGRRAFGEALDAAVPAIGPITRFDTTGLRTTEAAQVGLDPASLLGSKGLRYMSRSTHWLQCATHLALEDAGLAADQARDDWMFAVGTAFGSLEAISGFDHEALRHGPSAVNPMAFPNTVVNAPAGQTAIRFGLRGPNITLSVGSVSGLSALGFAMAALAEGRVTCAFAGGVDELSEAACRGYDRAAVAAGRPRGVVLGEGAALLVLESAERARARGASVIGVASGFGEAFGDGGAEAAIRQALDEAGRAPADIDAIASAAGGAFDEDAREAAGLAAVFGDGPGPAAFTVKALCGEALGASGAFQAAAGLHALATGVVPPLPPGRARRQHRPVTSVLVTASNADGQHAALVLDAPGGEA